MRGQNRSDITVLAFALTLCLSVRLLSAESPKWLIAKHADWKFYAAKTVPPDDWRGVEFDDSGWESGPAGFGYGDNDDRTVLESMRDQFRSVYIRKRFEVTSLEGLDSLFLYLNYDDGFIAYLNGHRIASDSVRQVDGERAIDLHEADGFEEFVIRDAAKLVRIGQNVLAIEGHNAHLDSSDFSLDPCLLRERLPSTDSLISREDLLADLDDFEERLLSQSAYLTLRDFDYQGELESLRNSITDDTTLIRFASSLQKLVMKIGDCHAGVYSARAWPVTGFLPFRPAQTKHGIGALKVDAEEPLDADCPYVESIDSIPLDKWLAAAGAYAPQGSPQLIRWRSLRWLSLFTILRQELGLPASESVLLGLRSADSSKTRQLELPLTNQGFSAARVPLRPSRHIDGGFGYLRLPIMDRRLIEPIVSQIRQFKDTDGLIIDVRDNDGSTYAVLNAIYGFFVAPDAAPYVSNVAAYRLAPSFPQDYLAYRPTYRARWEGWSDAERAAIAGVAEHFHPQWQLPREKFSEWHYMVLSRERGGRDYFHYKGPVVVLCNSGSFSATDGFLGAFSDLPQITLVGGPSGGGSGASRRFQLKHSEVFVALSTMASFRANGMTFDGNGIPVDVEIHPALEDYITDSDSILDRGIAHLRERLAKPQNSP